MADVNPTDGSMIITDRHLGGPVVRPEKADAPLIVDSNRMLSSAFAGEKLK